MGAMTLTQMVNSVFAKIDVTQTTVEAVTQQTRPEIVRVVDDLNDAYNEIFQILDDAISPMVYDVVTTQTGVGTYPVSTLTSSGDILFIHHLNGPQLHKRNLEEVSRQYVPMTSQGSPNLWYRYDDYFGLYPVPNQPYDLRVISRLAYAPLTAGDSTTVLPAKYDRMLRFYAIAAAKAYWRDGDATFWLAKWREALQRLQADAWAAGPPRVWVTDLGDCMAPTEQSFLLQGPNWPEPMALTV